jgi:hypothetical protein
MRSSGFRARFAPLPGWSSGWALPGAVFRADFGARFCVFALLLAGSLPLAVLRLDRCACLQSGDGISGALSFHSLHSAISG